MSKKEWTVKELCEEYNISRVTSDRYRKLGLPFIRRGRAISFVIEDAKAWMEENFKVEKFNYDKTEGNKETPTN